MTSFIMYVEVTKYGHLPHKGLNENAFYNVVYY